MGIGRTDPVKAAQKTLRTSVVISMALIGVALFEFFPEGTGLTDLLVAPVDISGLSLTVITIIMNFFLYYSGLLHGCDFRDNFDYPSGISGGAVSGI